MTTRTAPRMGDIGEPVREVEFEPIETPTPVREPERTPA